MLVPTENVDEMGWIESVPTGAVELVPELISVTLLTVSPISTTGRAGGMRKAP